MILNILSICLIIICISLAVMAIAGAVFFCVYLYSEMTDLLKK